MELTFTPAEPVATNRGRKAEENPFSAAVQSIALKTDNKGQALALKTPELVVPVAGKDEEQAEVTAKFVNGITAKLKNAGLNSDPQVTVYRSFEFLNDGKNVVVTFWTGKKVVRRTAEEIAADKKAAETAATEAAKK